ncbi:2,3-bisphosphoglycerate-dependent phosphoglycerate mutase [Sesamum angolense]|uniref:phosphoglycerate mutase (2,3-diphosphoglycerate-dependent) n=1 Tax=Sesamum angolense TaxID=2727404 RepID=A0AAE1T8Y8_9LAMI|nr:2,3-bisphosphoglycerate-dependent phosphoglycerate mutase [Sesamum angolense]
MSTSYFVLLWKSFSWLSDGREQYYIFTEESTLILMRHGESMWNEKNLFTGCVDVPLTSKGVEEAIEAGKRISSLPFDIIYTSALIRAQMTTMLALTQHRCMKIEPQLLSGMHVMVVAHANSLREGNFIRRGSPVGSSEAGVYAYTERLAAYREKLDETSEASKQDLAWFLGRHMELNRAFWQTG